MTTWYSNYHPSLGHRRWEDARGSERGGGFISHGGDERKVRMFAEEVEAGDLLYVKLVEGPNGKNPLVPKSGFVGIARALAAALPSDHAQLLVDGQWLSFDDVPKIGLHDHPNGAKEYVLPVEWLVLLDEPLPVPSVAYRQWVLNLDTAPTGPRSIETLTGLLPLDPTARSMTPAAPSPVDGGQGYSDLTWEVERVGMSAVLAHFEADGWEVEDVSAQDGLGYDVVATDGDQVLYVEVKATAGTRPWVWFTPSEIRAAEAHPEQWWVAVVTRARSPEPDELQWFTAADAIDSAQPDRFRARLGEPN